MDLRAGLLSRIASRSIPLVPKGGEPATSVAEPPPFGRSGVRRFVESQPVGMPGPVANRIVATAMGIVPSALRHSPPRSGRHSESYPARRLAPA